MKWSVKALIVCKKKVDCDLIQKVVYWVIRNSKVCEPLIVRGTLLIDKHGNGVRTRVTKLLLECSLRKLHNELISPASEGGLEEVKYRVTGELIISNTILRNIIPRRMQEHHENCLDVVIVTQPPVCNPH